MLSVEVVYATPEDPFVARLVLPLGATIADALNAADVLAARPALRAQALTVGVFGRIRAMTEPLADGDRVEIYRPLRADPKQARSRRVERLRAGQRR